MGANAAAYIQTWPGSAKAFTLIFSNSITHRKMARPVGKTILCINILIRFWRELHSGAVHSLWWIEDEIEHCLATAQATGSMKQPYQLLVIIHSIILHSAISHVLVIIDSIIFHLHSESFLT
jgi:hypothetical protein